MIEGVKFKDPVRFLTSSRFGDFKKGDTGVVVKVLSKFPDATAGIYYVKIRTGPLVWCTSDEITPWNQLSLF